MTVRLFHSPERSKTRLSFIPIHVHLCAEVLAKSIRDTEEIKGFNIGTKNIKIKQYADDTQIFSQFNGVSLNAIIETFDNFANASGLLINYDKTEVLRIGPLKTRLTNSQQNLS